MGSFLTCRMLNDGFLDYMTGCVQVRERGGANAIIGKIEKEGKHATTKTYVCSYNNGRKLPA